MKLLYFSKSFTTHDRRFLNAFVEHGFQVSHLRLIGECLDTSPYPEGISRISWLGDSLPYQTENDHMIRRVALDAVLNKTNPDIILAGPIQSCTKLIAETEFSPFVAMSWGSDLLVDAAPGTKGEYDARRILETASAAFGDCQMVKDAFHRLTALPDEFVVAFPWGIDTDLFNPNAGIAPYRLIPGWEETHVIISTRSWESIYAVDVLVEAFNTVSSIVPNSRLVLIGDGSLRDMIKKKVKNANLDNSVFLPGWIANHDLPAWLSSADLYVSTALSDGTSISLLEAMGCGLPVIVTNGYGNLEWVEPVENGWLIPPGSHEILSETILAALGSREKRNEMAKSNRNKIDQSANWKQNVKRLCFLLSKAKHLHEESIR